ncbi:hypothetical protein CKW48_21645, partial [Bordetella pertussis]
SPSVGGGFVGLWTALAAKAMQPTARVIVLERDLRGRHSVDIAIRRRRIRRPVDGPGGQGHAANGPRHRAGARP